MLTLCQEYKSSGAVMIQDWNSEAARFLTLKDDARRRWFVRVLYQLTMLARGTYTAGGLGLDDPERMRRFNELLHRIASQQRENIEGISGRPDDVFLKIVGEELAALKVDVTSLIKMLRD
jgi:hypothetical protein